MRVLAFTPCGDWNGDGATEIAVGLPRDDAHGVDAGRVYVISSRDGSVVRELHSGVAHSGFGFALASGPDVDVDGKPDLVVASHRDGFSSREGPGSVRTYSSASGALVCEFAQPAELKLGVAYASAVDIVGDLDGDGSRDVLITSRIEGDFGGTCTSPLVILSAKSGELLRSYPFAESVHPLGVVNRGEGGATELVFSKSCEILVTRPTRTEKADYTSLSSGALTPRRLADAGDLDGDGRDEIAVLGHGFGDGRCTDAVVIATGDSRALFEIHGEDVRRRAGVDAHTGANQLDACGAPDIDGDGRGELFVVLPGAYRSLTIAEWARIHPDDPRPLGASMCGYAALVSSRDGKEIWTSLGSQLQPLGWVAFEHMIEQVRRVPDLDGDGLEDLAVSSAGASTSEPYEEVGARIVVLSSKTGAGIATFDFGAGKAPVARFRQRPVVDPKGK